MPLIILCLSKKKEELINKKRNGKNEDEITNYIYKYYYGLFSFDFVSFSLFK